MGDLSKPRLPGQAVLWRGLRLELEQHPDPRVARYSARTERDGWRWLVQLDCTIGQNGWTASATGRLTLPGGHALVAATGRGDDWSGALGTLLALLRATWNGVPWL